jgi:hypothetical protein
MVAFHSHALEIFHDDFLLEFFLHKVDGLSYIRTVATYSYTMFSKHISLDLLSLHAMPEVSKSVPSITRSTWCRALVSKCDYDGQFMVCAVSVCI